MTTRDDLIYSALSNHIGPCDFTPLFCHAHDSQADGEYCAVMNDAIDAAGEAVLAVLADLRQKAEALDIVEPQYPAIHDAVDRDEVLHLFGGVQ